MKPLTDRPLTLRQTRFALEYLVSGHAEQAANRAGYSPSTARASAHRLLANAGIRRFVAARLAKAELTAQRTLEEVRRVAFFDIRELFDDEGHLKSIKTWPAEVASAVASSEVVRTNLVSGDGKREWLHKVRAVEKMPALALLAKHFRLIDDHVDVSGNAALIALLDAGRARNAAAKLENEKKKSSHVSGHGDLAAVTTSSIGHPDE